ncbi:hypothetical protein WICPIJ_004610 [Wickerhamomyces pijperi]|uniref:Ankyrin repeat-containing protein YAR1 n=1 Tax=Wickerhamomyces pijperi TaxID=599730 RepID=A0A9P8TMR2_WICPI|nr:hypothetical protein WICPIJ_004610 [Wickerhamomyces pijperi]
MSTQTLTQEEYDIIIEDARYGDLETLQEIFAEIDPSLLLQIQDEHSKTTTLHMAAANGHLETVKYLLSILPREQAVQLTNFQNSEGNTPLHWAVLNGHLPIVELLCEQYEADAFIKNKVEHDAIFEAENNGKDEIETYLLKKFDVEPVEVGDDGEIKVQVSAGTEIESASKEQIEDSQTNEEFIQERTAKLSM